MVGNLEKKSLGRIWMRRVCVGRQPEETRIAHYLFWQSWRCFSCITVFKVSSLYCVCVCVAVDICLQHNVTTLILVCSNTTWLFRTDWHMLIMQIPDQWSQRLEGSADYCNNSIQFLHSWDACTLLLMAYSCLTKSKLKKTVLFCYKGLTMRLVITGFYIYPQSFAYYSQNTQ